jgi:hypothetical protein
MNARGDFREGGWMYSEDTKRASITQLNNTIQV